MPIKLLVYCIVMMQYQNHLFLDTKSSAENKYIKFVKHDAFPVPNGKDGASARKRTKVNPPKEKRNSSATVQQKQMDQRKLPDSTSLRTIWQRQSSAIRMERRRLMKRRSVVRYGLSYKLYFFSFIQETHARRDTIFFITNMS